MNYTELFSRFRARGGSTVEPSTQSFGWLKDQPDSRDYTVQTVSETLAKIAPSQTGGRTSFPAQIDLRQWCSPVSDQGRLGSCTAQAAAGLVEYFENRAYSKYTPVSRLFIYKATRNLLKLRGDTGASLRASMGALTLCGAPPETYWPYVINQFDVEPSAFVYALAENYQSTVYYRIDPLGVTGANLVDQIKSQLRSNLPMIFGFTVFRSYSQTNSNGGAFPYPTRNDSVLGGHAVVAVGYDDAKVINNTNSGGLPTTGAFLIRNSWGTSWGDRGYGWLPYQYAADGLASDWWSLINQGWVDSSQFL